MRTHTPTIGGKQAVDSTGKSESEICSPQDPIVYLSCRISGCNCQHHGHEASWDLVSVGALKIRCRLWYQPTSWFRPPAVAAKSVSHHHRHPAWQRTEQWQVCGDTGMMEMGWATGSIYPGDPGVDRLSSHLVSQLASHLIISSHLIIQRITHSIVPSIWSHSYCPRFRGSTQLLGSSQPRSIISSHPLPMLLEPEPLFLTNSFWNAARGAAECWWWALCLLAPPFHHTASRRHMPHATHHILLATRHLPHASQCLASATQQVSGSSMQEEWSLQREAFGRWKTLSLWKLWLIEGSRSVEALATTRLKVCGSFDTGVDVANLLV